MEAVVRPNAVTATSDEPTANRIGMPVEAISAGTTRNPPPIPKKPDSAPVAAPEPSSFGAFPRSSTTSGSPSRPRERNISPATTSISTANSASSRCPSMAFPAMAPNQAPSEPAMAKVTAHRHFTFPLRAWFTSPISALAATARALVPMATCGSPMRTR